MPTLLQKLHLRVGVALLQPLRVVLGERVVLRRENEGRARQDSSASGSNVSPRRASRLLRRKRTYVALSMLWIASRM